MFGGLASIGKTASSYRIAIEWEIARWKPHRDTLHSEIEKEAFEGIMDMCRNNAMAAQNSCKPILFEPMVMSILLGQQKEIKTLQRKIDALPVATLPITHKN